MHVNFVLFCGEKKTFPCDAPHFPKKGYPKTGTAKQKTAGLVRDGQGENIWVILETMQKLSVLLILLCAASAQAVWLYTTSGYNFNYNLYAINTDTYTVYTIGEIVDSDGDKFTARGMYYDSTTGLLYCTGASRTSNPAKQNGLFAVNPVTAQGTLIQSRLA
jgi:hypothetical protein